MAARRSESMTATWAVTPGKWAGLQQRRSGVAAWSLHEAAPTPNHMTVMLERPRGKRVGPRRRKSGAVKSTHQKAARRTPPPRPIEVQTKNTKASQPRRHWGNCQTAPERHQRNHKTRHRHSRAPQHHCHQRHLQCLRRRPQARQLHRRRPRAQQRHRRHQQVQQRQQCHPQAPQAQQRHCHNSQTHQLRRSLQCSSHQRQYLCGSQPPRRRTSMIALQISSRGPRGARRRSVGAASSTEWHARLSTIPRTSQRT
mmetsp:Transcript_42530/g.98588  ORF Transcript_42530/g.98588 Transcript_42530/m.98588 type:complete len:255 (+) Transcript_42530:465-1229(+)